MTGADYIAEFLASHGCDKIFCLTGGACAFILDAIARHPKLRYYCFQHEQAAAMAADAVWRVTGKPGVTVSTSGPGATNLITGIACSYFDSIPSIHITGQVNQHESAEGIGAKVRQAGFQETDIVSIVRPLVKYAVQVKCAADFPFEFTRAWNIATSDRMGPVLIDVPMNLQKEDVGTYHEHIFDGGREFPDTAKAAAMIRDLLANSLRPLVLVGAGIGLAGQESVSALMSWLAMQNLPFVASWSGMTHFNHNHPNYCGHVGVYGNRGANYIVQNCDALLVLGSRLDGRQRSSVPGRFAPHAKVLVLDIDGAELSKYASPSYKSLAINLRNLPAILDGLDVNTAGCWWDYIEPIRAKYLGQRLPNEVPSDGLSPYAVVQRVNELIDSDAIVVADCGANLCWVYQVFHRTNHTLFTAAGNSPMGYSLPAAIGAAIADGGKRQVVCFIGDGGLQINIQELQTIDHYNLPIKIVILNNRGYGIIKQFQDSYFEGRHVASGDGYSAPDFYDIFEAYGIPCATAWGLEDLHWVKDGPTGPMAFDVQIPPNALIQPKLEMGRPIHDQFPYVSDEEFEMGNRFVRFAREGKTERVA